MTDKYINAMNAPSRQRELVLRLLWDVCKPFGTVGECVFIVFKHRIGEAMP